MNMGKFRHSDFKDVVPNNNTGYDKENFTVNNPFNSGEKLNLLALTEKGKRQYDEDQRKLKEIENYKSIERLKINSLMNEKFKKCRFENFHATQDNIDYLNFGKYYAYHFDKFKAKNQWILIYGKPGTGKSYLSFCIANYLIDKRVPVIACSISTILEKIREFSSFGTTKLNDFYRAIEKVDLLIIDDLGSENTNEYVKAKIYNVIDLRYRSNKPLIITTNLDPNTKLKEKLTGKDGISRTYDRIYELSGKLQMNCEPRRIVEGDRQQQEFNKLFNNVVRG